MAVAGQNTRRPQRGKKILINQSKPHLVIISIKLFTCQSFRQNYFSREIEWAVFTEVPENIHATPTERIGFSQGKGGGVNLPNFQVERVLLSKRVTKKKHENLQRQFICEG